MWCSRDRLAFSVFCSFMLFYCCRLHSVSDRPTGCCSCVHRKQQLTPGLSYEHTHLHCILGAMLQHIFHCPLSYRHCLNLCLPVSILRLKFYASGFSLYGAHCVLLSSLIANFLLFFILIQESQSHLGWKRPLSPAINLTYQIPSLNCVPYCHIHAS